MKKFLALLLSFLITVPLYAAERAVLVNGSGEEVGTAGNPLKISVSGMGTIGGSTGSVDNALITANGTGGSTIQSNCTNCTLTDVGGLNLPSGYVLTGATNNGAGLNYATSSSLDVAGTTPQISMGANMSALDVILYRDAAAQLALRNSTTAQSFAIYETYSDTNNYERLRLYTGSDVATIAVDTLGSGTDNIPINIVPAGTGNVGIGTTTPDYTLDVERQNASMRINAYTTGTDVGEFRITGGNTQGSIKFWWAEQDEEMVRLTGLRNGASNGVFDIYVRTNDVISANPIIHIIGSASVSGYADITFGSSNGVTSVGAKWYNKSAGSVISAASYVNAQTPAGTGSQFVFSALDSNGDEAEMGGVGGVLTTSDTTTVTGDLLFKTTDAATTPTTRWRVKAAGHLLTEADNTYDIGASGATRPRDVFVADDVIAGGDVDLDGDLIGDGGDQWVGFLQNQVASTTTTLTAAQCASTIVFDSADVMTLPEASTVLGCQYTFIVNSASNCDINPNDTSDQIVLLTNAAGDAIRADAVGESVTLQAIGANVWAPVGQQQGTWTDVD